MIVVVLFAVAVLAQAPKVVVAVVTLVPVDVMHVKQMPGMAKRRAARIALPAGLLLERPSYSGPVVRVSGWGMRGSEI